MTGALPATRGQNDGVQRWVMAPGVKAAVEALLDQVPKSEGADDLVLRILEATDPTQVNMQDGDTMKVESLYGQRVVVESIKRLDSDHDESNLTQYLRVEGYAPDLAKEFAISTGSQIAVIALAKLYTMGKFPAVVVFSMPPNWTGGGRAPTNVRYIGPAEDPDVLVFKPQGRPGPTLGEQIRQDKARRAATPKPADSDKPDF